MSDQWRTPQTRYGTDWLLGSPMQLQQRLGLPFADNYIFYLLPKETIMPTPEQTTPAEASQQPTQAEAYLLSDGDINIITTCLIGFKWLLDWAKEMVAWIEANTDLDASVQPDEYGNTRKTNREWVAEMKSRLADHTSWYMAAKDINKTAASTPASPLEPLPHLKLTSMPNNIRQEKSDDDS